MLPTFKELNSNFDPAAVKTRIDAIVKLLGQEIPDGQIQMGEGDVNKRYAALLTDIKKRADHTGIHGLKHDLALYGKDVAEEVVLFVIEQALVIAQTDAGFKAQISTIAGGDPNAPDKESETLRLENDALKKAVTKSGEVVRAMVKGLLLGEETAKTPEGQPSGADLLFFSQLTYKYLDKALWHTLRARKAKRMIDAYKAANGGKMPLNNCADAALASFFLQTYFHHFHKAKVYSSPMIALVEFTTHWVEVWRKLWAGNSTAEVKAQPAADGKPAVEHKPAVEDKAALRNLANVYETITAIRAKHKTWDCVNEKKGELCYGPKDDPKKQSEPLKTMKYTDGTAKLKPAVVSEPWFPDMTIWALDQAIAMTKGWEAAGNALKSFWTATKMTVGSFYDETLEPLLTEDSIFKEDDARDNSSKYRDLESVEEVMRDTRLQFERFAFWVMNDAPTFDWKKDETFTKRNMRRMVSGTHDDLSHAVDPPYTKIFKSKADEETAKVADAHVARMMYDVYGLVEAKDFGKNVKNLWKKKWSTVKKGEMAVTMLFLGAGIAISICTMGAGLPVMALVGIAAAKKVGKKAALKGVKKANSSLNSKTLKGADLDPNTELVLNATEAREEAASLARHFVSSFKNIERMKAAKAKFEAKGFESCADAAGYAYAAHAFDHHFTKTLAKLQHLTAMSAATLTALDEGEKFFKSDEFAAQRKAICDLIRQPHEWHVTNCDGKQTLRASLGSPVKVSHNLKSCICYRTNELAPRNQGSPYYYPLAVQRGLFFMDYTKPAQGTLQLPPPTDMLEQWVNARDVLLVSLKAKLEAEVQAEKDKLAKGLPSADRLAVIARCVGQEGGA